MDKIFKGIFEGISSLPWRVTVAGNYHGSSIHVEK